MPDLEILSEKPISLSEVKKNLEEIKKRDKELNFRSKKTELYLNSIKLKGKKAESLREDLESLNIIRLKPRTIIKIIDLVPTDPDSLRIILSGENITPKQEDVEKIVSIVKKYA